MSTSTSASSSSSMTTTNKILLGVGVATTVAGGVYLTKKLQGDCKKKSKKSKKEKMTTKDAAGAKVDPFGIIGAANSIGNAVISAQAGIQGMNAGTSVSYQASESGTSANTKDTRVSAYGVPTPELGRFFGPTIPWGKIIRIQQTGTDKRFLNIGEIKVFSLSGEIKPDAVKMSSIYNSQYNGNLVKDNNYFTFAHTNQEVCPWIELQLDQDYPITAIQISNRKDNRSETITGSSGRINGSVVSIRNSGGNFVFYSSPIRGTDGTTNYCYFDDKVERGYGLISFNFKLGDISYVLNGKQYTYNTLGERMEI